MVDNKDKVCHISFNLLSRQLVSVSVCTGLNTYTYCISLNFQLALSLAVLTLEL